jgi:hypothetical protein
MRTIVAMIETTLAKMRSCSGENNLNIEVHYFTSVGVEGGNPFPVTDEFTNNFSRRPRTPPPNRPAVFFPA